VLAGKARAVLGKVRDRLPRMERGSGESNVPLLAYNTALGFLRGFQVEHLASISSGPKAKMIPQYWPRADAHPIYGGNLRLETSRSEDVLSAANWQVIRHDAGPRASRNYFEQTRR